MIKHIGYKIQVMVKKDIKYSINLTRNWYDIIPCNYQKNIKLNIAQNGSSGL